MFLDLARLIAEVCQTDTQSKMARGTAYSTRKWVEGQALIGVYVTEEIGAPSFSHFLQKGGR